MYLRSAITLNELTTVKVPSWNGYRYQLYTHLIFLFLSLFFIYFFFIFFYFSPRIELRSGTCTIQVNKIVQTTENSFLIIYFYLSNQLTLYKFWQVLRAVDKACARPEPVGKIGYWHKTGIELKRYDCTRAGLLSKR